MMPAVAITSRPRSWTVATPRLPAPALMPSARPFSFCGKKKLMLVVEEAKLPPPMPLTAAQARSSPGGHANNPSHGGGRPIEESIALVLRTATGKVTKGSYRPEL